jgi:peroxiredoxin Q/BCP|tara:strand:+ start:463 stop:594 length:132 start_codon:yes stop_codon:yes gene_type:complete
LLKIGDRAPDFTLPDSNNNPVSLADYSGEKVVLWFFPKASTPG